MVGDADLSAQRASVLDDDRAGEADLRREQTILADAAVVRDVDEVVDLGAGADERVADAPAVDCRVGADLDVVADQAAPDVWNLLVPAVAKDVPEAVRPDAGPGVDRDTTPELHPRVERHVREQAAALTHADPRADDAMSVDDDVVTQRRAVTDHGVRADAHPPAEPGPVAEARRLVHAGTRPDRTREAWQEADERRLRIRDNHAGTDSAG
jgi:hypothetical protein